MRPGKDRKSINYSKDPYPSLFPGLAVIVPVFRILFEQYLEKLYCMCSLPGPFGIQLVSVGTIAITFRLKYFAPNQFAKYVRCFILSSKRQNPIGLCAV